MKKLFITIGSIMVMSTCSMAQLQDRDTTSMNNNDRGGAQETSEEMQKDARNARDTEQGGAKIQLGVKGTKIQAQQGPQSTDQELENETASINKEGPNGEKLFMKRGKYFYYNEEGKKVKVKKSEVRDRSVDEKSEVIKNNR